MPTIIRLRVKLGHALLAIAPKGLRMREVAKTRVSTRNAKQASDACILFLCLLCPLAGSASAQAPVAGTGPSEGLWRSEGYGYLLEIGGNRLRAYEVTSVSCVAAWQATRAANPGQQQELVFMRGPDLLRFTLRGKDEARLRSDGSISDILLRRVSQRPKVCGQELGNTPQINYSIFWQTFAENYPFFHLHQVDWDAANKKYGPRVRTNTSPQELFGLFREMIDPLHDAHVSLEAGDLRQTYRGSRPGPDRLDYDQYMKFSTIIWSKYVRGELKSYCKGKVWFGMLDGDVGYLLVPLFIDYSDGPGFTMQARALDDALDQIFRDGGKFKGLVIDVRHNSGGYDGLGLVIASRLTDQRYLAYSKKARDKTPGVVHFTSPQSVWVDSSARPGFTGRVALLIGPDCVSACETFTMALMGRKPSVIRIGESTQGVYSDVLDRKLPNGWHLGLPNEIYLTRRGQSFDGVGVPPDLRVPVFTPQDLQNQTDPAIEAALRTLH